MDIIGFESCLTDLDIWRGLATKPDGQEYFEYVLLYVDDCLVIPKNPEEILLIEIGRHFKLKEEVFGSPSQYLGVNLIRVTIENGQ